MLVFYQSYLIQALLAVFRSPLHFQALFQGSSFMLALTVDVSLACHGSSPTSPLRKYCKVVRRPIGPPMVLS